MGRPGPVAASWKARLAWRVIALAAWVRLAREAIWRPTRPNRTGGGGGRATAAQGFEEAEDPPVVFLPSIRAYSDGKGGVIVEGCAPENAVDIFGFELLKATAEMPAPSEEDAVEPGYVTLTKVDRRVGIFVDGEERIVGVKDE